MTNVKFIRNPVAQGDVRDFWYYLYIQSSWSVSFQGVRYSRIESPDAN